MAEMLPKPEVIQVLTHATVFVCPSVYEPMGIVNLEAMACETAVVATATGGIPEVVEDGVTGFIVENEEQAVRAVGDLGRLDRRKVRARFEERFSANRMARAYESAYCDLISAAAGAPGCGIWRQA